LTGLDAGVTYYAKIHEYGDLYSIEALGGCSPNGEAAITFMPLQAASVSSEACATSSTFVGLVSSYHPFVIIWYL
jgi:Cu-Zn family superoxide dismutase